MNQVSRYRDGGLVGSTRPSERQKAAGNYPKGHAVLHGMRISIENEAGTNRHFTDEVGYKGKQKLRHDYGYIRGTTGKDKDHIDVFLGPRAGEPDAKVHVVDQNKLDGEFDEHKVMLGFEDADDAVIGYHSNYEPGFGGFHAVTEMPLDQFKSWAYAGRAGKRKRASELVAHQDQHQVPQDGGERPAPSPAGPPTTASNQLKDREPSAGDGAGDIGSDGRSYAEGGSIDETKPFVGYRSAGRRKRNDREAAADLPVQLVRGIAAGTAGLPGDVESLLRLLPGLDRETLLPTSEDMLKKIPGQTDKPAGRAANELGSLLGLTSPWTGGAKVAAKGGKALANLAGEALDAGMHGEGALSKVLAPAQPAFAVKPRGGNWTDNGINRLMEQVGDWQPEGAADSPVTKWLEKRFQNYIRNDMGTAADPLLKLEAEGRLHLMPEDLVARAEDLGPILHRTEAGPLFKPADPVFHERATGRKAATPWEIISDSAIDNLPARSLKRSERSLKANPWLSKLSDDADVWTSMGGQTDLGFGHVRDYLNQAVQADDTQKFFGGLEKLRKRADDPRAGRAERDDWERVINLVSRDLHINADDLPKMSLPDVIRKTSDWNKLIYKTKQLEDMNKGIKSVLKQYPDSGHQWVELAPEGLKAEGDAMRHCVGGYCSQVEGGNTRVLSLRDKEGRPYTTVELNAPDQGFFHKSDRYKEWLASQGVEPGQVSLRANKMRNEGLSDPEFDKLYDAEVGNLPWHIQQIKGPANRSPSKDVLPMVQDLVKNMGPWGDVRDLFSGAGLRRSQDVFNDAEREMLRGKGRENIPGYLNQSEIDELQGLFPKGPFPMPESYAKGGTVPGVETVGLGTFGGADVAQPHSTQLPAMQLPAMGGAGTGASQPSSQFGGVSFSGGQPVATSTGNAPVYDLNTPAGQGLLGMTMGAMGAGRLDRGVGAFMDPTWSEIPTGVFNQGIDGPGSEEVAQRTAANNQPLLDLMRARGQDVSGIDPSRMLELTAGRAGMNPDDKLTPAYQQANRDLADYWRVTGASAGWDGKNDPRGMASTLYRSSGNVWSPISMPKFSHRAENPGWVRGEGSDFVAGMSMMLPAVGGWAGLASTIAPSAVGAASGAIGTTATNALINGLMGGLVSGDPLSGLLSAGSGALGGAAGQAIGDAIGPGYGALGQYLGSQGGRLLYNQSRRT